MSVRRIFRGLAVFACLVTVSPGQIGPSSARGTTETISVYTDYQCSPCARMLPRLNELKQKYGGELQFSFENFPLPQHKNAWLAACAAEAAGNQGKFVQMHDRLFAGQGDWSHQGDPLPQFKKYAQEMNLDVAKFSADVSSAGVKNKVAGDLRRGQSLGVTQTPTVVLDGKMITGTNLNRLEQVIDESLSDSNKHS